MTTKNSPHEKNEGLGSSALKVNLERTAVTIEIPEQYAPLLEVVSGHYGLQKKTRELLMELNHPLVNWEYVLKELKSISIGDFYLYNNHQDGLSALSMMLRIYFDVIKSASSKDIKDSAIHYLFDYMDTILTQSNEFLPRNLFLFPEITESLDKDCGYGCDYLQEMFDLPQKNHQEHDREQHRYSCAPVR